jgi:branched-chain amino acid aminotransferase group I
VTLDPRNESIVVHVGGRLVRREDAKVSVFDSAVQGGDAVWEGLRVYSGRVFALDRHLDRLFASAHALAFASVPTRDEVKRALFDCLKANGMRDGVHVRLTLTRGLKRTSGMDPRNNTSGPTLIVLPEWKPPADTSGRPLAPSSAANASSSRGLRLVTASTRRNSPACLDSKIHHANLLNNILAKLEANAAGADDALMLDLNGFVAETNSTNVFLVKRGVVVTPLAEACLPGITRATVIELCRAHAIECRELHLTPADVWTAEEMFTTGTLGELAPVSEVDGRAIGDGRRGPVTARLQALYGERTASEGEPIPS